MLSSLWVTKAALIMHKMHWFQCALNLLANLLKIIQGMVRMLFEFGIRGRSQIAYSFFNTLLNILEYLKIKSKSLTCFRSVPQCAKCQGNASKTEIYSFAAFNHRITKRNWLFVQLRVLVELCAVCMHNIISVFVMLICICRLGFRLADYYKEDFFGFNFKGILKSFSEKFILLYIFKLKLWK